MKIWTRKLQIKTIGTERWKNLDMTGNGRSILACVALTLDHHQHASTML
jgi:hypothetical protein